MKMENQIKSILHELYVYSEWKPEPEYTQKQDNILPENISALWRWLNFFGPKKSLIDSVNLFKERQQKWHIALGDEGKVIAVLTDNILEIRTKRSEYATIAARTTVNRDPYPQWRKLVWSPDCSFLALAYGNGTVSFFDLTASNLFDIPADCSRPGGLECTDTTHAVADIIFMPLRVKDNKWNWEVAVVTHDGRLRGFLVSQTEGPGRRSLLKFEFAHGVAAIAYCSASQALYAAGTPRGSCKDPSSPLTAGLTAWRVLNDEPYYKLSMVSDELEAQLAKDRFQLYIPFLSNENAAIIVKMSISPDSSKLVCLHCNGEVSIWRLPLLKLLFRFPLITQPAHDMLNPFKEEPEPLKDASFFYPADVNWWSNEEIILSRFSGSVSVCNIIDMINLLGKQPEFFQGTPQVTRTHNGAFMALECESNILPAKKSSSDESMEVLPSESDTDDSLMDLTKELLKSFLYAVTDMETFQPKPKRITVVSRVYRLLGVKSTTPMELFSRKIESGNYSSALKLAETFDLDVDLVYQQQWRKEHVSAHAIQEYLSKVSKKVWAVHQCVDRLPESLNAANELLSFGLQLTNEEILQEINKDRDDDPISSPDDITLEDLNAYTSELLRCRHVMLFYKERLRLYDAIIRYEKSQYDKDEYDRLRSNSIVHSAMEIAKEGRLEALTCLWPQIKSRPMQLTILDQLPETINPLEFQHLLPVKNSAQWFEKKSPIKITQCEPEVDWCRKKIFQSIWSSNWSEDTTPETETSSNAYEKIASWYEKRAREIEDRSGLVSHALTLVTLATSGGGVTGLDNILFYLLTLDTLIYDINVENVSLKELEKLTIIDICYLLMKKSTASSFVSDLKSTVVPFLKRHEKMSKAPEACIAALADYLRSLSVQDLSYLCLVLKSPSEFALDVRTHLEIVEKCLLAHTRTDQLDLALELIETIPSETDGSISHVSLGERSLALGGAARGAVRAAALSGSKLTLPQMWDMRGDAKAQKATLAALAPLEEKPTQHSWEKLLQDLLELQSTLFNDVTRDQVYEIYASSLLTSHEPASIRLAADVLTCSADARPRHCAVGYARSVELALKAARDYFNSASALGDPALEHARCCLTLIKDGEAEIRQEIDLINALQILHQFNLNILPIQVRLCEDKMTLVEECLKQDPNAYHASHKLLKLASLLRIAGDDDRTREAGVTMLVCSYAIVSGGAGCAAAAAAARRLAALRAPLAASALALVAESARAHADLPARRHMYAAAAAYCQPADLQRVLAARLGLELEGMQQSFTALKEQVQFVEKYPSTDEEFADAITTPIIEKKDLVAPSTNDNKKNKHIFSYLVDSLKNKLSLNEDQAESELDQSVHCQEFYRTLYPEHAVSDCYYGYDRFAAPDDADGRTLHCYYVHSCLKNETDMEIENEVIQNYADEVLYKDTALSAACLLRSTRDSELTRRFLQEHDSDTSAAVTLYAALANCNAPALRDNVYLTKPRALAELTLKSNNASEEHSAVIRDSLGALSARRDATQLRSAGISVDAASFHQREGYRRDIILRLASSPSKEHLELAIALSRKYGACPLHAWLQHAALHPANLVPATLPSAKLQDYARVRDTLWPNIPGSNHQALINYFTVLHTIDPKPMLHGLSANDHIKLLKKAKAACNELDYKLLLNQPTAEEFSSHVVGIMRSENVALLGKFLRTLPAPPFRLPLPLSELYTAWLTSDFFDVGENVSSKKWMQQYRQCASYFNKLTKSSLTKLLADTCFSKEAVDRVPASTRSLMLMQAVDYCQQEQENDFKANKNEISWLEVGQQLSHWATFLDNFHSSEAQEQLSKLPKDIRIELEMSSGQPAEIVACLSASLAAEGPSGRALAELLRCLQLQTSVAEVIAHALRTSLTSLQDVQTLVEYVIQNHKEGIEIPEDLLEEIMRKATEYGLPPHKQIGLLSLSQKTHIEDDDLAKLARYTLDLMKAEWGDSDYVQNLTDEVMLTENGRRETYAKLCEECAEWRRKKTLVDILSCWPVDRSGDTHSLQCEHMSALLSAQDQKETAVLVKLMMRRPLLTDQEVQYLTENVLPDAVLNVIWIMLLSKSDSIKNQIPSVIHKNKEHINTETVDDDFIKELLDNGLFLKLVSTPIYPCIICYIMTSVEGSGSSKYTVQWAIAELLSKNYLAEAGHLKLISIGVPASLRGFTQTFMYCKNMLSKN